MKKFLLVLLVGMVLVMNLYGIVNKFMVEDEIEIDHIAETTMTVYMEQLMLFLLSLNFDENFLHIRELYKSYYEK